MRRLVFLLAAFAALVGAGAAWSMLKVESTPPSLTGGGHWDSGTCFAAPDGPPLFCSPFARDFSVEVQALGRSGTATGTLRFGWNGTAFTTQTNVTCMTVEGNKAVIGGYITQRQFAGDPMLWYVIDNGGPGGGAYDQASPRTIFESADSLPAGFPKNCGEPISVIFRYTDLLAGDVSMQGAT